MTTKTTNTPRIWIGCLHCYNDGRLIGEWYDANEIEDVDLAQVHQDGGYPVTYGCEELWGFDHENMPVRGEMDPTTAAKWGEAYDELDDDDQWPAFMAYARNHNSDTYGIPSVTLFQEAFMGEYDTFSDYVYELAEETDMMRDWPEDARSYFNWDSYTRTQEQDYWVENTGNGTVWVFSACL